MRLDHVVLWVDDPIRSAEFFEQVVGLVPVRLQEFKAKQALFPSVRISPDSILDLLPRAAAPQIDRLGGTPGTAGHPIHHVALAMTQAEWEALASRLTAHGVAIGQQVERSFGACGLAAKAFYFRDPDGNVFEARYYAD